MTTGEPPPARPSEARALAVARELPGQRVLATTLGRAQGAAALALDRPSAGVTCWFLDEFHHRLAARQLAAADSGAAAGPGLVLALSPDPPPGEVDLAVVPLSRGGEAELARDLLQGAWQRLEVGGTLVAAVDNPNDRWVRQQVTTLLDRVRVTLDDDTAVYVGRKDAAPRRVRDFRCEFAVRDGDRLLRAVTRPGVFSHRRMDAGARQLLRAVEAPQGARMLEIGCGAGVVAMALAARDPTARVLAVDSHTRAVECTRLGAKLNGLQNLEVELNSTGDYGRAGEFDVAVANPPYYGDFAVAQRFVGAAALSLAAGGRLWVVTKSPQWYEEALPRQWDGVQTRPSKRYWIVTAVKRPGE